MPDERPLPIAVGDRICFRSHTKWGSPKLTRVVKAFFLGEPCVAAHGHSLFVVRHSEILGVFPKPQAL